MGDAIRIEALMAPMEDGGWPGGQIRLEPISEAHREGMRACCQPDDPVWPIYPTDFSGEKFDGAFDGHLANRSRHIFAVLCNSDVVGMTSYLNLALDRQALEIGGTFMAPSVRGTGINGRVKRLLLNRAFGCGVRRVEFRIDERNARSQAAAIKLGATKEGVLRAERITWTGHVRDTGVFSILADEWVARPL